MRRNYLGGMMGRRIEEATPASCVIHGKGEAEM